jgi:hypothetical protein
MIAIRKLEEQKRRGAEIITIDQVRTVLCEVIGEPIKRFV